MTPMYIWTISENERLRLVSIKCCETLSRKIFPQRIQILSNNVTKESSRHATGASRGSIVRVRSAKSYRGETNLIFLDSSSL